MPAYGVNFTNPEINLSYAFLKPSTKGNHTTSDKNENYKLRHNFQR